MVRGGPGSDDHGGDAGDDLLHNLRELLGGVGVVGGGLGFLLAGGTQQIGVGEGRLRELALRA